MPAINQPKLGELYNTTFFTPSSVISSIIIPKSNVAWTDGQGGVYYVTALTLPMLTSTVEGLGTAGYVSSTQLLSTVADLGTAGYISSTQLYSTIADLATGGYISSTQLFSTVVGLGSAGYLSTLTVQGYFYSTTAGLGSANYVSSTQLISTTDYFLSNYVNSAQLISTAVNLGSIGYVSSTQLISTTNYFLDNYVSSGQLLSTTVNLGSLNYISSSQLLSTVQGLGSANFVSSTQLISSIDYVLQNYVSSGQLLSTVNNLGSLNYVSSSQLISTTVFVINNYVSSGQLASTVNDLSQVGYVSSTQLLSTVAGLGAASYVSSSQLVSTTSYFLANYVSSGQALSTTISLGSLGYVSSQSLISTVDSLLNYPTMTNLRVLNTLSTSSTFTNFVSSGQITANTISANTVVVWGSNTLIVQGASLLSTTTVTGNLNVSSVSGSNGFVNSTGVSTNQVQVSSIRLRDTASPAVTYNFYATGGAPFFDSQQLIFNGYLASQLVSTAVNLGSLGYISSTQLSSTINTLGLAGFISSPQLLSTVANLGSAGYISSTQLLSTVEGLGLAGFISTPQIISTVAGLGSAGYISTQQLTSTFVGLTQGFVTSTLRVATSLYATSSYTRYTSTTTLIGNDITSIRVLPIGAFNIARSSDATNWVNPTANGFLTQGNGIAAGNNLWVAAGDADTADGVLKWSVDGLVWNNALNGVGFTGSNGKHVAYAVAYSPQCNLFVAGGEGATASLSILRSTDGKNWAYPINGISKPVYGLVWASNIAGGRWIAVGDGNGLGARSISLSSNGINWTPANNGFSNNSADPCAGYDVAYDGVGRFWAVGYGDSNNNMLTSVDGSNWSKRPYPGTGQFFTHDGGFGVAYSPTLSKWVAVGNTMNPNTLNYTILYSDNAAGTNWYYANNGGFAGLVGNGVIWDGTQFVAVGSGAFDGGAIQVSTDASNWSSKSGVPFEYYGSYSANRLAYSNSYYVAVGDGQTLNGGVVATLINPSSISTSVLTAGEIYAESVYVTGQNTLTVSGNSYFDGPAEFSTTVTTSSLNVNGDVNVLGKITLFGSNLGLKAPFVSTMLLQASTLNLADSGNGGTNTIFTSSGSMFVNSNLVLVGGGSSGTDLTLNNLRVLNTVSSSSTFTNYVSTTNVFSRYISTQNIYTSTVSLGDIQYPWVVHKLFASSSHLYFDNVDLTSSFYGSGCSACFDSNISFSNAFINGSLSTFSTFTNSLSTTTAIVNSVQSQTTEVSTLQLQDSVLGGTYNLYAQNGNLFFGVSSIGIIPNVVNSNLWVDTLRVNVALSTNAAFANTISAATVAVSTLNLVDQTTGSSNQSLYTNSGLLYFGNSQVLPLGNDMMFSSIGVKNTISTSSTFMSYLSTAQLLASTGTITNLIARALSTNDVQLSSLRFVDTAVANRITTMVATNNNLIYNGMAVPVGGSTSAAPQFSTLRVAQTISTSSTFTQYVSTGQLLTSSIVAQGIQSRLVSTANTSVSSLTFVDGSNRNNLYASGNNLFYNTFAIPIGGSNSQNGVFSTLTTSSLTTNTVSSMSLSAFQVTNTSSLTFVDSITGSPNYLYTSNAVLYLNQSPGIGVITVSSNFNLTTLNVADTISTSSTFANYISSASIEASTISTTLLSVFDSTITQNLTASNMVVSGNTQVNTVNTRPYPIFNYGTSQTCCSNAFTQISFGYQYSTKPVVTVSLCNASASLAIIQIMYIDTVGFTVGTFAIDGGAQISGIGFSWMSMGT